MSARRTAARERGYGVGATRETVAAQDLRPQSARAWTPGRLLLWCAGVDRTALRTGAEAMRYANMGALMVAVAILAATTFTIFASVVMGSFRWYLLAFGAGWGILILLVDRSIVTETHYRERAAHEILIAARARAAASARAAAAGPAASLNGVNGLNGANGANGHAGGETAPPSKAAAPGKLGNDHGDPLASLELPSNHYGWPYRTIVYTLRVVMAVCIAFLVSEAALLLIFHPEVEQELARTHAAQYQQLVDNATSAATRKQTAVVNGWVRTLSADNAAMKHDERASANWNLQADAEEGGLPSGPEGPTSGQGGNGPAERADFSKSNHFARLASQEHAKEQQDQRKYNAQESLLTKARQGDPKALRALHVTDPTAQRKRIYGDNGFYAQDVAFNAFTAQHSGSLLVEEWPWLLRFLLISIDLIPLTTKLLNRYTIYGRRLSERALLIRYSDLQRDQETLHDIEHDSEVTRMYRTHDLDMREKHVVHDKYWQAVHVERDR